MVVMVLLMALSSLMFFAMLFGCVRYLPLDAATYKAELDRCQKDRETCGRNLTECKGHALDLMRCP